MRLRSRSSRASDADPRGAPSGAAPARRCGSTPSARPSSSRPRTSGEDAARAARALTLDPEVLFAVGTDAAGRARGSPYARRPSARSCRSCRPGADAIAPGLDQLALAIEQAIDAEGVRDGASPRLRSLRREQRGRARAAGERLRELASSLRAHLQEEFLTERGGRPVLAVRADARGAVPGIVHDASGLGPDPLRRAVRARRAAQPAARAGQRGARGGRAHPHRALAQVGAARRALARRRRARELDLALACGAARAARRGLCGRAGRRRVLVEGAPPAARPRGRRCPIDLRSRVLRTLVISGAEHGRQDRRPEDARPRRR